MTTDSRKKITTGTTIFGRFSTNQPMNFEVVDSRRGRVVLVSQEVVSDSSGYNHRVLAVYKSQSNLIGTDSQFSGLKDLIRAGPIKHLEHRTPSQDYQASKCVKSTLY